MIKINVISIVFFTLILNFGFSQKLIVIQGDSWLPFNGVSEQGEGYMIDCAKEIFEPLGRERL